MNCHCHVIALSIILVTNSVVADEAVDPIENMVKIAANPQIERIESKLASSCQNRKYGRLELVQKDDDGILRTRKWLYYIDRCGKEIKYLVEGESYSSAPGAVSVQVREEMLPRDEYALLKATKLSPACVGGTTKLLAVSKDDPKFEVMETYSVKCRDKELQLKCKFKSEEDLRTKKVIHVCESQK